MQNLFSKMSGIFRSQNTANADNANNRVNNNRTPNLEGRTQAETQLRPRENNRSLFAKISSFIPKFNRAPNNNRLSEFSIGAPITVTHTGGINAQGVHGNLNITGLDALLPQNNGAQTTQADDRSTLSNPQQTRLDEAPHQLQRDTQPMQPQHDSSKLHHLLQEFPMQENISEHTQQQESVPQDRDSFRQIHENHYARLAQTRQEAPATNQVSQTQHNTEENTVNLHQNDRNSDASVSV